MLDTALVTVEKAIAVQDTNFAAHKWRGIILSEIGNHVDTKIKIGNAYFIRDEFARACELNPGDGTSRHLLGRWCVLHPDPGTLK